MLLDLTDSEGRGPSAGDRLRLCKRRGIEVKLEFMKMPPSSLMEFVSLYVFDVSM